MTDSPHLPPADAGVSRRCRALIAALAVVGLYVAFAVPLIFFTPPGGRAAADEADYHRPAILRFAQDWPHCDLRSYTSATTPGYHLLLAAVARYVSADLFVLRLAGALFTVGLLATAAAALARRVGAGPAVVLCLPLVCSSYVFKSGVWILPENAAWWGLLGVLLLALRPKVDAFTYVAGGVLLAALVLVRQMHIWSAAVLWLAAWLGTETDGEDSHTGLAVPLAGRVRRATLMVAATLPAFLIVGYFVRLWGGMVPAIYRLHSQARTGSVYMDGGNPAVPAMILSLTALAGVFFLLPFAWSRARSAMRADRRIPWLVVASALLGAVLGIVPKTSYDAAAGRWSGLWNAVPRLPVVADRSVLIAALSSLGGAVVVIWFFALGRRDRWIFLATFGTFTVAQSASSMAWQRYYEPFLLILFALMAARVDVEGRRARGALLGPAALAVLLAAITVLTLR
jgi:hypothetical protein